MTIIGLMVILWYAVMGCLAFKVVDKLDEEGVTTESIGKGIGKFLKSIEEGKNE